MKYNNIDNFKVLGDFGIFHNENYMEASEHNVIGVNSLRLGGLYKHCFQTMQKEHCI